MSRSCDGTYEVYLERTRKARKDHTCDACKLPIRAGDHYASVSIVFDGEAETVKRCGACQTTHLHLRELCSGSDYKYEQMWPDEKLGCGLAYDDEWGEDPPDEIAALPFLSDAERGQLLARPAKEST